MTRAQRLCDACHQLDDTPRHFIESPTVIRSLHMDCCASTGCESCAATVTAAQAAGQTLTDHVTAPTGG